MFTFGREHELSCARKAFKSDSDAELMLTVVNAVHDLLEGKIEFSEAEKALKMGIVEGNRATWDKTGSWLLKMSKDYPETEGTWKYLATHPKAEVRYRVACHVGDFPDKYQEGLYNILINDKSKKVRSQADGKWDYFKHPEKYM
jgi:hypothetical protein